jgi:ureidoglycolate hydrolase
MENVPAYLSEISEWFGPGYKPLLDFHGWRVAALRYADMVDPKQLHRVERHNHSNEVFILTAGEADLILMDGGAEPTEAHVFPMRMNVAYNLPESVWHHVVMSPEAHIILVERSDVSMANSNYAELPAETIAAIRSQFTIANK